MMLTTNKHYNNKIVLLCYKRLIDHGVTFYVRNTLAGEGGGYDGAGAVVCRGKGRWAGQGRGGGRERGWDRGGDGMGWGQGTGQA